MAETTDPAGDMLTEAFEAMGIKVVDVTPAIDDGCVECECGERRLPIDELRSTADGALVCRECLEDLVQEQNGPTEAEPFHRGVAALPRDPSEPQAGA